MGYNFSPYVSENYAFLQKLAKTKSNRKKNALLLTSSSEQILAILEIIHNVLKFNFTLTRQQKRKLAKFADYYRAIARSRTEKAVRRHLQQGGSPALAAILIPVVASIAEHIISRITTTTK